MGYSYRTQVFKIAAKRGTGMKSGTESYIGKSNPQCYRNLDFSIAAISFAIFWMAVWEWCDKGPMSTTAVAMAVMLVTCGLFFYRGYWIHRYLKSEGWKVTDNPAAYEADRVTSFAYAVLLVVAALAVRGIVSLNAISAFIKFFVTLACLTPFVTLLGSGWNKLTATKSNKDSELEAVVWPLLSKQRLDS